MQRLLEKIREILRNRRTRRLFSRAVSLVAAFLVFVTTYALVLPAITMEKTASCGMDEHQHSDSCYESVLICGQEESEGHHHDDSCYTVTKELNCQLEEHRHSREVGCYDEEGNLICQLSEHTHDDSCYREVKTLTCGREESEGHHHTDACYEKVLVCGKEVHTHSETCYKDGGNAGETNEEAADQASSVSMPEDSSGEKTAEAAAEEKLSENYVPKLDALNMETVFGKKTGFYYFHAGEGQEVPSNSTEITDWRRVKEDTKLAPTDLVKMYLLYSIPAGSLNGTNSTARYRLPANIHLTDDQIKAINKNENGITAGFSKSDPEYRKYLGAVAIEGDRTPDKLLKSDRQEYISAVVRAENVYENDKYLGQDLIFTFVPYTIAKNQKTFDKEKKTVSAGKEVTGWFACDFRPDQIDWIEEEIEEDAVEEEAVEEGTAGEEVVEEEVVREEEEEETDRGSADPAEITVEKTAEILFVSEDKTKDIKEIKRTLKLVDTASEEEGTEEETQEFQVGTLTADGDGYKITLDYTEEAKIPENASLSVCEITAETDKEAYEACLAQAQQHVDESGEARSTVDSNASRFFDIEIQVTNEDGTTQKIEPAAPVSVNIQIADAPAANDDTANSESGSGEAQHSDPTVLHFAEDGVEQIEATSESVPTESGNEDASEDTAIESKAAEVRFEAESFSIYGVVYTVVIDLEDDGVYRFEGEDYTITITCPEEANIPVGTKLTVSELDPDSDEYIQRLGQAWHEVNREYFEVEEMRENYNEGMGDLPELPLINLDHARFFNISLVYEDKEIDPDVPVQVEIVYNDGMTMAGEVVSGVVRYTKDAVELIDKVDTVTKGSDVLAFKYEQTSISDTGTYVGQKTYDEVAEPVVLPEPEPMQYPMLQKKAAAAKDLKAAGNGDDEKGEKGETKGEETDLAAPIATKTLTPNKAGNKNDGTYTLELAIDGRAKSSTTTEIKKSNVLIVMDRSSSMINNIAKTDVTQVAHYDSYYRKYYLQLQN